MSPPLDPVPEPDQEQLRWFDDGGEEVLSRPVWWRWVAVVLVITMVVATPFVYVLSRVFR